MQTWLITGISSGFGYEMAKQLLARGDRVVGTVRNTQSIETLKKDYPQQLKYCVLDITDVETTQAFVQEICEEQERIDVVVSNAGYGVLGAIEELTDDEVEKIIATNFTGSIIFIKSVIEKLREQGGGRIIQMSSYNAQVSVRGWGMYCATKAGISSFCETLAKEVAPFNIGVTIVEPGAARTDYFKHVKVAELREEYAHCHTSLNGLENANDTKQGDPVKMVKCIIDSVNVNPAPSRLILGSLALEQTIRTLKERISIYEEQRQMALSTDVLNNKIRGKKKIYFPQILQGKKVVVWSVGQECEKMFEWFDWSEWDMSIECFVDKNSSKVGKICRGRKIKHPKEILDWSQYFVVVASTLYYDEIAKELISHGLVEKKDFISWRNLIDRIVLAVACQNNSYLVSTLKGESIISTLQNECWSVALEQSILKGEFNMSDVDMILYCSNPLAKLGVIEVQDTLNREKHFRIGKQIGKELKIAKQLENFSGGKWRNKVYFCGKNVAEAKSALMESPYEEAAVVVYDNDIGSTTVGVVNEKQCLQIKEMGPLDSIELFYDAFTGYYVEWKDISNAKKKAAIGKPVFSEWIKEKCICVYEDGSIVLNRDFFTYDGERLSISLEGMALLQNLKGNDEDLISSVQNVIEQVFLQTITYAKKITGQNNVCLVGANALALVEKKIKKKIMGRDNLWIGLLGMAINATIGGAVYGYQKIYEKMNLKSLEIDEVNDVHKPYGETNWKDVESDEITFMKYSSVSRVNDMRSCIDKLCTSNICDINNNKRQILVDILENIDLE